MVLSFITADMSNKKTQNHKIPNHATVFKCEVILNWRVSLHLQMKSTVFL